MQPALTGLDRCCGMGVGAVGEGCSWMGGAAGVGEAEAVFGDGQLEEPQMDIMDLELQIALGRTAKAVGHEGSEGQECRAGTHLQAADKTT